jgi:hypothetical protein
VNVFVAMPYGVRNAILDPTVEDARPVQIDFDDVWHGLIEPALPDGWTAFRADELNRPGIIGQVYIERLLDADLVVADITFANPNVYYELGIRQALSPRGTPSVRDALTCARRVRVFVGAAGLEHTTACL